MQGRKNLLAEVAENMRLVEIVCLNPTGLLHDPMSKLKQAELHLLVRVALDCDTGRITLLIKTRISGNYENYIRMHSY